MTLVFPASPFLEATRFSIVPLQGVKRGPFLLPGQAAFYHWAAFPAHHSLNCFVWDRVSCSLCWLQTHYIAEDDLALLILQLPPPEFWVFRPEPSHSSSFSSFSTLQMSPAPFWPSHAQNEAQATLFGAGLFCLAFVYRELFLLYIA